MEKINLDSLEKLSQLVFENCKALAHARACYFDRKNREHKFEYYNLLSTCILRIRETSNYVNNFNFERKNQFGQAFDFYEFISCLSIIFGCTESLLNIFSIKLSDYFVGKNYFSKSNKTKENDYDFFKFIRSAAVAHPENTTHYHRIAKRKNEIYPYAIWTSKVTDLLITEEDKDADISLLSWSAFEKCRYKRYYLYIDEFYSFINSVVEKINGTIPIVEELINKFDNNHRCKRLKKKNDFPTYHDYLMYLRKRILAFNTNKNEFPDGGLLIVDHIISNPLIDSKFKKYLKCKVFELSKMMIDNFNEIGFSNLIDDLDLYGVIKGKCKEPGYVNEKFYSYLQREASSEIESGEFSNFVEEYLTYAEYPDLGSDALWAVYKLFTCKLFLERYMSFPNYKNFSYADIFEISLELIFEQTIGKK